MADRKISLLLGADTSELDKKLRASGKAVNSFDKQAQTMGERLKGQVESFGSAGQSADIWRLRQKGVREELLKEVEALDKNIQLMKRAQKVIDDTTTPLEKFEAELRDLQELQSHGLIDENTFSRAKKQLEGGLKLDEPFKKSATGLDKINGVLGKFGGTALGIGIAIGVVTKAVDVGITAFKAFAAGVSHQFEEIDRISKQATKFGVGFDHMVALEKIAERAGVGVEDLGGAMQNVSRRIGVAAAESQRLAAAGKGIEEASTPAAKALNRLGLDAEALAAMSPDEAFLKLSAAMSNVENVSERMSLAKDLGDADGKMAAIGDSAKAFTDELIRSKALGTIIDPKDAKLVEAMNDKVSDLGDIFAGLYRQAAVKVAPAILAIATAVDDFFTHSFDMAAFVQTAFENTIAFVGGVADVIQMQLRPIKALIALQQGDLAGAKDAFTEDSWSTGLNNMLASAEGAAEKMKATFTDAVNGSFTEIEVPDIGKDMEASLHEEIQRLSVGDEMFERMKLQAAGVAPEVIKTVEALQLQKKALEESVKHEEDLRQTIVDTIKGLHERIFAAQHGSDALEREKLAMEGVNSTQLDFIDGLKKQAEAFEKIKKHQDDLNSAGEKAKDNAKSEVEKLHERLQLLQELKDSGRINEKEFDANVRKEIPSALQDAMKGSKSFGDRFNEGLDTLMKERKELSDKGIKIDDRTFAFSVDKLKKDVFGAALDKTKDSGLKLAGLAEAGSVEARTAIINHQLGNEDPVDKLHETEKQALKELQNLPQRLADIFAQTEALIQLPPP